MYIFEPTGGSTIDSTGAILRHLAGSLGQGMAGKIVELRAALLVSGAVRLFGRLQMTIYTKQMMEVYVFSGLKMTKYT